MLPEKVLSLKYTLGVFAKSAKFLFLDSSTSKYLGYTVYSYHSLTVDFMPVEKFHFILLISKAPKGVAKTLIQSLS